MPRHRYRLRFMDRVQRLPYGTVLIGRSDTCHVVLDGDLVSREHVRLEVRSDGVSLTDLGSVNGCHVNGRRVEKVTALQHGDTLRIAFFDLVFEAEPKRTRTPATIELLYCPHCRAALSGDMNFCVHCGSAVGTPSHCPGCGTKTVPRAKFCSECGRVVRAVSEARSS